MANQTGAVKNNGGAIIYDNIQDIGAVVKIYSNRLPFEASFNIDAGPLVGVHFHTVHFRAQGLLLDDQFFTDFRATGNIQGIDICWLRRRCAAGYGCCR
ncbi:MAG: hypothetical protein B7Z26_10950 [Asticcacaulis sp. 32-58-5]|nr:MAG: hypothetical protein B7Z26_10950 [Asticcacaulis sp. 32-58-5]